MKHSALSPARPAHLYVFLPMFAIGMLAIAGCITSRPVMRADLVGIYGIQVSFDTRERIALRADGVATYESIPLLADAGDSWTGRWELRGDKLVLIMPIDSSSTVEIPLQIARERGNLTLSFSPKNWSEVFMVLPGDYIKWIGLTSR